MDVGQSRRFYRQGYLKIPGVIPPEKVFAARREMFLRMGSTINQIGPSVRSGKLEKLGETAWSLFSASEGEIFIDLFNKTELKKVLEKAFGSRAVSYTHLTLPTKA